MAESIKSKYRPSFPSKYKGDPTNIICRSSWERKFCHWCDLNESIIEWGSEEFYIPYLSPVDNRVHKYYIHECMTYEVNQAKWKAAVEFCKDHLIEFKIITEEELGIK
jgi:hypothetical protein